MTAPSKEYRLIPLTRGQSTKVDLADFEWLSQWKWQAHFDPSIRAYYAVRTKREGRQKTRIILARMIMGLDKGDSRKCDHINHDTLDNRRENLRVATNAENCMNRKKKAQSKSDAKCVQRLPSGRYRARICANGVRKHLGVFLTIEEARRCYNEAAKTWHGEFAFPS